MHNNWLKLLEDYKNLTNQYQDPNISSDPNQLKELGKKIAGIEEVVEKIKQFQKNENQISETKNLLNEKDYKELATMEIEELQEKNEKLTLEITDLLTEKDPDDIKNAIVEIRAGTGGEEASLFAEELMTMLFRFAENQNYKVEIFQKDDSDTGGIKDATFAINGKNAYGLLKFESGIHRVQRVPKTESKGRLHTSAASIFIIPEAKEEEFDIPEHEIRFETFRSSGPGGQSVNTTDSAVRLTHIPTELTVSCQDEKSQHKNRVRAMSILRARLAEHQKQKQKTEENTERKDKIGSGDRSEKIRTWNFPQDRMTDHRLGVNFFGIKKILEGDLNEVIKAFKNRPKS